MENHFCSFDEASICVESIFAESVDSYRNETVSRSLFKEFTEVRVQLCGNVFLYLLILVHFNYVRGLSESKSLSLSA